MTGDEYLIELFELDPTEFDDFAELISISFLNDESALHEGASIYFTKDTFNLIFNAPSEHKKLYVRTIHRPTNQIVGFLGLVPRNIAIKGEMHKCAIPAWLCVHPAHQKNGLAKKMAEKLLEAAKEVGYEGGYAVHEPEQHGIDVSKSVSKAHNITMRNIMTLNRFIIRIFDIKETAKVVKFAWYEKLALGLFQKIQKVEDNNIRLLTPDDAEEVHKLLLEYKSQLDIVIVPSVEEIKFLLANPITIALGYMKNNKIAGFVIAWEFFLAGFGHRVRFGWLDAIHTHYLTRREATNMFRKLCVISKDRGWMGLQTPYFPYFDVKPLKKANFIVFPKILTIDFFELTDLNLPETISSCYLDWR